MARPNLTPDVVEGAREAVANQQQQFVPQAYQSTFGPRYGNAGVPQVEAQPAMPNLPQEETPDVDFQQEMAMNAAEAMANPLEYLKTLSVEKEEEVSLDSLTSKQKDKILRAFMKCRDVAQNYYQDTIEPEILYRREIYYADEDHYKQKYPQLSELCRWVSKDVKTACDWLLPSFMEVFTGSDDPVSVKGVNIEDDAVAEKLQQLIRYQLEKKNSYQQWVYAIINDALKENFGVAKVYWKHEEDHTPMEVMLDKNDPATAFAFAGSVASGKIKLKSMNILKEAPDFAKVEYDEIKVTANHPVVEYIPSSELRYTPDAPTLQECKFVAHRKVVHGDYLKRKERDGIFKNIDKALEEYGEGDTEPTVMDMVNDFARSDKTRKTSDNDIASKEVELYEAYIDVDYNDDGIYEKLIVHAVGDNLLRVAENEFEQVPFFVCSVLKDPNTVFSKESLPTNFEQIQDLKTAMIRQVIVNVSKNNSPRTFVNQDKTDMDALINNEEIIPTHGNPSESIFQPASLPLSSITMDMVNYAQNELEAQSGSTRYNQGLDSQSLNRTATGITAIMGASEKRTKLLARSMAESFFIQVFKFLIKLNQMFLEDEQMIRLTNESVTIRKDELDIDYDLTVNVGQGAGTKEAQIQYYMYIIQTIYPILAQQNVVNAASWYNLVKKLLEAMGIRDVQPFLLDPSSPEAQQAQAQAQQQAMQAQAQQMQQAIQLAIAKYSVPRVNMNLTDLPEDVQQQYLENTLGIETTEQNIVEHEVLKK